jgi:ligand-binding sensor domain-containing protein
VRLAFTSNLVETRDGYLWLSSESGFTRFDGMRFKVFDGTNTPALVGRPRLQTVPLLEDHDGALWMAATWASSRSPGASCGRRRSTPL